jgi:phage baseplate assembly protein W
MKVAIGPPTTYDHWAEPVVDHIPESILIRLTTPLGHDVLWQ